MLNNKKFTLDWLQFIEQLKDRISRGNTKDFKYQLIIESREGITLTLSINVSTDCIKKGLMLVPDVPNEDDDPNDKKRMAKLSS